MDFLCDNEDYKEKLLNNYLKSLQPIEKITKAEAEKILNKMNKTIID